MARKKNRGINRPSRSASQRHTVCSQWRAMMIRRASIQNALLFFMFATSWQRDSPPVAMAGVDAFVITQSTSETVACRSRTANKDLRRQPVVEMLKARSQCNNVFVERRQQSHQFRVGWAYTRREMVSSPASPPSSSQPQACCFVWLPWFCFSSLAVRLFTFPFCKLLQT